MRIISVLNTVIIQFRKGQKSFQIRAIFVIFVLVFAIVKQIKNVLPASIVEKAIFKAVFCCLNARLVITTFVIVS